MQNLQIVTLLKLEKVYAIIFKRWTRSALGTKSLGWGRKELFITHCNCYFYKLVLSGNGHKIRICLLIAGELWWGWGEWCLGRRGGGCCVGHKSPPNAAVPRPSDLLQWARGTIHQRVRRPIRKAWDVGGGRRAVERLFYHSTCLCRSFSSCWTHG